MVRAAASPVVIRDRLDARLREAVAGLVDGGLRSPKGAIVRLEAPSADFAVTVSKGLARADGEAITPDHAFHVASIGKLVTTALVLQLVETGNFGPAGVEACLGDLGLLEDVFLDRLHVREGESLGRSITLRQLLTHTAGLGDIFSDDSGGLADDRGAPRPGPLGLELWRSLKARRDGVEDPGGVCARQWAVWDPDRPDDPDAGLLNRYLVQLGPAPVGRPGERFHYSDQGFTLLALLAERASARPYPELQRTRVFEPLGMTGSWMHRREPPPEGMADLECDVWMNGVPMLEVGGNLSFDFGGGGQVMTAPDAIRLLRGLLDGRLFARTETLAAMTTWASPPAIEAPREAIGLGVQQWAIPAGTARMTGHAGAWGGHLWRDDRTGAILTGTVNQRHDGAWAFALLNDVRSILETDL